MQRQIYGLDFDGTLCEHKYPAIGKPDHEMLSLVKSLQLAGNKMILITNREGKELDEAVEWCKEHGIFFDAVNDNLPELIKSWGINTRKIFVNTFIDDRAKHVDDFKFEQQNPYGGTIIQRIEKLKYLKSVHGRDGNWDYDEYMRGMYNGMELALAVLQGRDANYRDSKSERLMSDNGEIPAVS